MWERSASGGVEVVTFPFDDLSDEELEMRLAHRGVLLDAARLLVADRDNPDTASVIEFLLVD